MKTKARMKNRTEARIKLLLTLLHKAVMHWYKEHPEGAIDPEGTGSYYGSAYFAIGDEGEISARMTLQAGGGHFIDIEAPVHHRRIKDGLLRRRQQ